LATGIKAVVDLLNKGDEPMTAWTKDEPTKSGQQMSCRLRPPTGQHATKAVIIVVRVGDDLYVRSAHGRNSAWFRGAQVRHEGHIQAGGVHKDVTFVDEADPDINNQIDAAYLTKYSRYPQYVAPMVTPEVRAATIKLVPQLKGS
jgi:hypothetical protein